MEFGDATAYANRATAVGRLGGNAILVPLQGPRHRFCTKIWHPGHHRITAVNCPLSQRRRRAGRSAAAAGGPAPFRLPYLLVTRRSAEVRLDALLRTACDVILARGLPNTRTADVAAAAGVSQALVFYHFETKNRLLAQAFAYAAEQDLARLDDVLGSASSPLVQLRKIIKMYVPIGNSKAWAMWIDGWAESMRVPELEAVSRRLDLRWKEGITDVIAAGVKDRVFTCDDPAGAAWRLIALIDGLAVQVTVHEKVISRRQLTGWVRIAAARELGLAVADLA